MHLHRYLPLQARGRKPKEKLLPMIQLETSKGSKTGAAKRDIVLQISRKKFQNQYNTLVNGFLLD
jgi:hypothetical protein